MTEPTYEINAADITTEVAAVHGFWLTPLDDDGQPCGETRYYPTAEVQQ